MVSITHKTRVGPKGQVVLPKLFRDNIGIGPGSDVEMEYADGQIIVRRNTSDIVAFAERIAKMGPENTMTPQEMRHLRMKEKWRLT